MLGIHREDVDLERMTLFVRVGKTAREWADQRTIPLSSKLVAEPGVRGFLEADGHGPIFGKRRHANRSPGRGRAKAPSETFKAGWRAAAVPEYAWRPPNRKNARPTHAFRAGVQAFLTNGGVAPDVIDFLVGHEGAGVREIHYGRDLEEAARDAVELFPPISWE